MKSAFLGLWTEDSSILTDGCTPDEDEIGGAIASGFQLNCLTLANSMMGKELKKAIAATSISMLIKRS